jgi:hypothetical protein
MPVVVPILWALWAMAIDRKATLLFQSRRDSRNTTATATISRRTVNRGRGDP